MNQVTQIVNPNTNLKLVYFILTIISALASLPVIFFSGIFFLSDAIHYYIELVKINNLFLIFLHTIALIITLAPLVLVFYYFFVKIKTDEYKRKYLRIFLLIIMACLAIYLLEFVISLRNIDIFVVLLRFFLLLLSLIPLSSFIIHFFIKRISDKNKYFKTFIIINLICLAVYWVEVSIFLHDFSM